MDSTTPPSLVVRRAQADDLPRVRQLLAVLHALHVGAHPGRFRALSGAVLDPQVLERHLASTTQYCAVAALDDGAVVGFVRAEARVVAEGLAHAARRFAEVHEIAVAPEARRHGAGRALMTAVQDWAAAQALPAIELGVYAFNRSALEFYRGIGFRELRLTLALGVDREPQK